MLEGTGYTLHEIDSISDKQNYPDHIVSSWMELADLDTLCGVARRVFSSYGY